jgi:hypothetical protein
LAAPIVPPPTGKNSREFCASPATAGYVPIETLAMNRKDYDPYKLAAQVQRELQSALNAS